MKKQKRKQRSKEEYIQVCPKCKSSDIQTDFSNAAAVSYGIFNEKKCNNCDHHGTFFPSIQKAKLEKPLSKKQVKDAEHVNWVFEPNTNKLQTWIARIILTLLAIQAIFLLISLAV